MPVIDTAIDRAQRTVTHTADFAASPDEVFSIYTDARLVERVWGPPTYPATFVDHVLQPGLRSTYYLTGPEGERYPGWWRILSVDAPHGFTFDDGFADAAFNALPGTPVAHNELTFTRVGSRTRAVFRALYASVEDLESALGMGAVEGATIAINQIDPLLKELRRR